MAKRDNDAKNFLLERPSMLYLLLQSEGDMNHPFLAYHIPVPYSTATYGRGGRESYDGVIVDVHCSNLDVFRRRVDAGWRIEEKALYLLVEMQFHLMEKGAEPVRAGSVLVYSTCTFTSSLEARH